MTQSGLIMQTRLDQLLSALSLERDDCIIWPFGCSKAGYPMVWDGEKMVYGHSEICRRAHGPRPPGTESAHSCGNRSCINKRHLRWATPKANCADKEKHGTNTRPDCRGELNWAAKLSEIDVRAIRESDLSSRQIAPLYGITHGYVRLLRRREKWAHI